MTTETDRFWRQAEAVLSETPIDLLVDRDDFYSQPDWDVFQMRYTSSGGHRLFAWLSVPHGNGPFQALIRMPDYGSVHDIVYTPLRRQAVVMNPTHRGQRNSDEIFQAEYPGLITQGIDNPNTYAMRGVFADALRSFDVLLDQTEVSISDVSLTGSGLGGALALAVAARRASVHAVAANTPLALGNPDSFKPGLGYPLAELEDYLRLFPDRLDAVKMSTMDLDPLKLASRITAQVLLSIGTNDTSSCPLSFGKNLSEMIPDCDLRVYRGASEGGGHEHAQVQFSWLLDQLGLG